LLEMFRALLDQFRPLLDQFRALLESFRALLDQFRALLDQFRALLDSFRVLLDQFRALLGSFRARLAAYSVFIFRYLGRPGRIWGQNGLPKPFSGRRGLVAEGRHDNSPAIYGWVMCQSNEKSREGRQKMWSPCASGGRAQAPFVPDGTLDDGGHRVPAMNGWAIVRGSGATPKRPPGRARSPAKSQPGGQWQFGVDERGIGCLRLRAGLMREKSGGGPPHSRTLAR
jgi:hypothetical protein